MEMGMKEQEDMSTPNAWFEHLEDVRIASLDAANSIPTNAAIRARVALVYPYSSSTESAGILAADPDIRQRRNGGQIYVQFKGAAAKSIGASRIGIGDAVHLNLNGASWSEEQSTVRTPGKSVNGALLYKTRMEIQISRDGKHFDSINIDEPETRLRQSTPPNTFEVLPDVSSEQLNSQLRWTSPAYLRNKRWSRPSLIDSFSPIASKISGADYGIDDRPNKRTKFWRSSGEWRYVDKSPTPPKDVADMSVVDELPGNDTNGEVESDSSVMDLDAAFQDSATVSENRVSHESTVLPESAPDNPSTAEVVADDIPSFTIPAPPESATGIESVSTYDRTTVVDHNETSVTSSSSSPPVQLLTSIIQRQVSRISVSPPQTAAKIPEETGKDGLRSPLPLLDTSLGFASVLPASSRVRSPITPSSPKLHPLESDVLPIISPFPGLDQLSILQQIRWHDDQFSTMVSTEHSARHDLEDSESEAFDLLRRPPSTAEATVAESLHAFGLDGSIDGMLFSPRLGAAFSPAAAETHEESDFGYDGASASRLSPDSRVYSPENQENIGDKADLRRPGDGRRPKSENLYVIQDHDSKVPGATANEYPSSGVKFKSPNVERTTAEDNNKQKSPMPPGSSTPLENVVQSMEAHGLPSENEFSKHLKPVSLETMSSYGSISQPSHIQSQNDRVPVLDAHESVLDAAASTLPASTDWSASIEPKITSARSSPEPRVVQTTNVTSTNEKMYDTREEFMDTDEDVLAARETFTHVQEDSGVDDSTIMPRQASLRSREHHEAQATEMNFDSALLLAESASGNASAITALPSLPVPEVSHAAIMKSFEAAEILSNPPKPDEISRGKFTPKREVTEVSSADVSAVDEITIHASTPHRQDVDDSAVIQSTVIKTAVPGRNEYKPAAKEHLEHETSVNDSLVVAADVVKESVKGESAENESRVVDSAAKRLALGEPLRAQPIEEQHVLEQEPQATGENAAHDIAPVELFPTMISQVLLPVEHQVETSSEPLKIAEDGMLAVSPVRTLQSVYASWAISSTTEEGKAELSSKSRADSVNVHDVDMSGTAELLQPDDVGQAVTGTAPATASHGDHSYPEISSREDVFNIEPPPEGSMSRSIDVSAASKDGLKAVLEVPPVSSHETLSSFSPFQISPGLAESLLKEHGVVAPMRPEPTVPFPELPEFDDNGQEMLLGGSQKQLSIQVQSDARADDKHEGVVDRQKSSDPAPTNASVPIPDNIELTSSELGPLSGDKSATKGGRKRKSSVPMVLSSWFESGAGTMNMQTPAETPMHQTPPQPQEPQAVTSEGKANQLTTRPRRRSARLRKSNVPDVLSGWFESVDEVSEVAVYDDLKDPAPEVEDKVRVVVQRKAFVDVDISQDKPTMDGTTEAPSEQTTDLHGFRTPLSYYHALPSLTPLLNSSSSTLENVVDIMAVVTWQSKKPKKAKAGPKDQFTILHVAQAPKMEESTEIHVFRPNKDVLPIAEKGDVILLRNFVVKSRTRECYLLSESASAWHVWRFQKTNEESKQKKQPAWSRTKGSNGTKVIEEARGAPVEVGEEEQEHARSLRSWYEAQLSHKQNSHGASQSAANPE